MSRRSAQMNTACAAGCSGWFSAAMTPCLPIIADIADAVSFLLFRADALIVRLRLGALIFVQAMTSAPAYRKG